MMKLVSFLTITTLLLTSCTLIPKYTRPEAPIPADWPSGAAYKENVSASEGNLPENIKWQDFFIDESLKQVISLALDNNRDLRVAGLNIEKARALYRIQRAELFPTVDAIGSGYKDRMPADISGTCGNSTRSGVSCPSSWP